MESFSDPGPFCIVSLLLPGPWNSPLGEYIWHAVSHREEPWWILRGVRGLVWKSGTSHPSMFHRPEFSPVNSFDCWGPEIRSSGMPRRKAKNGY